MFLRRDNNGVRIAISKAVFGVNVGASFDEQPSKSVFIAFCRQRFEGAAIVSAPVLVPRTF